MTLEEIKKTGDKKAILKYRTQCAKDSVKEYREQMRDATPEERESVDAYIKSISKPTGVDFDSLSDSQTIHHLTDKAYSELCLLAAKGREALQPSGDLIQRQAAIDIVDSYSESPNNVEDVTQDIISDIVVLPSVNPQPCEDVVSRQAVLSYIYNDLGLGDEENGADVERQMELERSYRYIKSLSPVNPQEPKIDMESEAIKILQKRSYLEGFHKAYQMYYKIFDDIKAEIKEYINRNPISNNQRHRNGALLLALEIIDKYKAESENKE